MTGLYINGKGRYQKVYDKLYKKLVPKTGKAKTHDGEILRLISQIGNKYYNNDDTYSDLTDDKYSGIKRLTEVSNINKEDGKIAHYILSAYVYESYRKYVYYLEKCINIILQRIMIRMSNENSIINPNTGRLVKITSPTGIKSIKQLDCELVYKCGKINYDHVYTKPLFKHINSTN
jgi:hypothetical protein